MNTIQNGYHSSPYASRGFIALTAVLMLAALSLMLSVTGNTQLLLLRESIADEWAYRAALANGWSCAQLATRRLSIDPKRFDTGTTTVHLTPTETCTIIAASTTDTKAAVFVSGQSGGSDVPLYVTAERVSSTAPFRLVTWELYSENIGEK